MEADPQDLDSSKISLFETILGVENQARKRREQITGVSLSPSLSLATEV
jgi:hypothetical protein